MRRRGRKTEEERRKRRRKVQQSSATGKPKITSFFAFAPYGRYNNT